MLFSSTHARSPLRKRLIVGVVVFALASFGALVYSYERYHRGPTESVFFGTWVMTMPYCMDCVTWVKFEPDHTALWFSDGVAGFRVDYRAPWFAAGPYIYTSYEGKRMIWQIIEVLPDELRLRAAKQDYIFKRVTIDPP